jgi:Uma2 family endonuclease
MSEPPIHQPPAHPKNEPESSLSPGTGASPEILLESPVAPPTGLGPYRRSDYDRLPDDQPRCELISGRLYASPTPGIVHQVVLGCLLFRMDDWLDGTSSGLLFYLPLNVALADHSVVQPDVSYVSAFRLGIVQERGIEGVPDLLVEVVSPETSRRDRGEKILLYAQCGVPEYWIVEPDARGIEFLVNQSGTFVASPPSASEYQSSRLPEVRFDLGEFWRLVDRTLMRATGKSSGPRASELLVNQSGTFVASPPSASEYQSPCIPELRIDLDEFWRRVDRRLSRLRRATGKSSGPTASS